jgi:hypothetical protein
MDNELTTISTGTAVLGIFFIALMFLGVGLGTGFYFGVSASQTGEVAGICTRLSEAYQGQIKSLETSHEVTTRQLEFYEDSLIQNGVVPGTTIAKLRELRVGIGGR